MNGKRIALLAGLLASSVFLYCLYLATYEGQKAPMEKLADHADLYKTPAAEKTALKIPNTTTKTPLKIDSVAELNNTVNLKYSEELERLKESGNTIPSSIRDIANSENIDEIIRAIDDPSTDSKYKTHLLSQIDTDKDGAIDAARAALDDDDQEVARQAIDIIALNGTSEDITRLETLKNNTSDPATLQSISDAEDLLNADETLPTTPVSSSNNPKQKNLEKY